MCLLQESIREIEESLNQQLFSATDLTLDKEQVILFDQNFGNCVFPNITLQVFLICLFSLQNVTSYIKSS